MTHHEEANSPLQGVGSYYDPVLGGATGKGLHKSVMDDYRFIVQNYTVGQGGSGKPIMTVAPTGAYYDHLRRGSHEQENVGSGSRFSSDRFICPGPD